MNPHEQLLEDYALELSVVRAEVDAWWANLLKAETQSLGDGDRALAELRKRWRDGPASHPRVLAVVRKYWLLCEDLNAKLRDEPRTRAAEQEQSHDFDPELTTGGSDAEAEPDESDDDSDDEPEEVYPHQFIHEWLLGGHDALYAFLSRLSYWAIGLDEQENYT